MTPFLPTITSKSAALPWRAINRARWLYYRWRTAHQLHSLLFDNADLSGFGEGALCRLFRYCARHVPYYQEVFARCGVNVNCPQDLQKLPLLTKAIIKDHFGELTSDRLASLSYQVGSTGGSTGAPLKFLINRESNEVYGMHQRYFYREFMSYDRRSDKVAAFDGVVVADELADRNVFWQDRSVCRDMPYGRTRFSSFLLNDRTAPYYLEFLAANRFSHFYGYPSTIYDLARHCGRLGYAFPYPIKAVQLTSEYASREQIDFIRKTFKTGVFLQYGQTECAFYTHTLDDTYEYWCSPIQGIVEVLDTDGMHVGMGEEGEVVATSFFNLAMPFIRYRTGDRAVFSRRHKGITYLTAVTGRTQDFVIKRDLSRISLTGLVFGQHFRSFGNITVWQIIQDVPGAVTMRIEPAPSFSKEDEQEIASAFKRIADIDCEFKYTAEFILTGKAKRRFLVQNIRHQPVTDREGS
jgi:phenylacetate-CoA ligase